MIFDILGDVIFHIVGVVVFIGYIIFFACDDFRLRPLSRRDH